MSKLLDKIKSAGSIKIADVLSESAFFNEKDLVPTDLPILNVAFSANLFGGFSSGLSLLAGASKSFKTMLGLYAMKAYLDKYEDAIAVFYDSEFGVTPSYIKTFGIDTSRIVHIPIRHIEELKFDIVKRLDAIDRGEKVFIFIDSVGNLASKKEVEDAENEKSVADMSRAKALKSLFRIITPSLTTKDLPCFAIMHTYKTMDLFPKDVVSGGTGAVYSANQIFIITKAQEKEGTEIVGYRFTINIEKSRMVREKSKLPFTVMYGKGIMKYSGLFDIALDLGYIVKTSAVSYGVPSIYGEDKFKRKASENNPEFWDKILADEKFQELIFNRFSLEVAATMDDGEVSFEEDEDE